MVPSIFKFLSFINGVKGLLTGGRTRTKSEIKWPGPHWHRVRGPVRTLDAQDERCNRGYLAMLRRRWIKIPSTTTKNTPEAIRIIVTLSIETHLSEVFL